MKLTKNKTKIEVAVVPVGAAWLDCDHFWASSHQHATEEIHLAQRALAEGQRTKPEIVHMHRYAESCDDRLHWRVALDG